MDKIIPKNKNIMVYIIAISLPLLFFLVITFVIPRPYPIYFTDAEPDTYYGSKLVYSGLQPYDVIHPAIPAYYIGALIMKVSGPEIQNAQTFFHISYFVIAIITIIATIPFIRKVLKEIPLGISLLSLIVFFCFSPVLTYSDMLSAASFIFSFAFLAVTFFWLALSASANRSILLFYCLTGFFLGLSVANHVVALLLAVVILPIGLIFSLNQKQKLIKRLVIFSTLPVSTILTYFLVTLPVLNRFPDMWGNIFNLDAVRPSISRLMSGLTVLFNDLFVLPESMTQFLIGIIFLVVYVKIVIIQIKYKKYQEFNKVFCQGLTIISILGIFLYTLSTTQPYGPPGITVRYTSLTGVIFSYAIIFIYRNIKIKKPLQQLQDYLFIILSVIIASSSITSFLLSREKMIKSRKQVIDETVEYFSPLVTDENRVAFWDGSPGFSFGEASFHFWGNYRYANDAFDDDVLDAFPKFTFLKLREADRIINQHSNECYINYFDPHSFWSIWRRVFATPCNNRNNELITGESNNIKVKIITFPEEQLVELRITSYEYLSSHLIDEYGVVDNDEYPPLSNDWILFSNSEITD